MDAAALHAAILLAIAVGLVASGLIGSIWELATGDAPEFTMLYREDFLVPLRAIVLVFSAPWLLLCATGWWVIVNPIMAIPVFILALLWGLFEGIFVLTQLFGLG